MNHKGQQPAFPGVAGQDGYGDRTVVYTPNGNTDWITHNQGITIRDYFAAAALTGLLAQMAGMDCGYGDKIIGLLARDAYKLADAMIEEREEK